MFAILGNCTLAKAKEIKVGAVINLTGPSSSWGQLHAKGQQDYLRYVNEVKGGIAGKKVNLIVVDHGYKVPKAVEFVKKFCKYDKVDILTIWDAGSGISAKSVFQKYRIPTINYSTIKSFLKPPIDYAYLPFGDYDMDTYAILEYIKKIQKGGKPPKVGLLSYNIPYVKAVHETAKKYAAKYSVNIVGIEQFPPNVLDLKTELLRLKNAGAKYIFVQAPPSVIIMALKSADRIKYNVPFFSTWTANDPDFFRRVKGLLRNRMFVQFCGGLPVDKTPGVNLLLTLAKKYRTVDKFDFSYWQGVVIGMIQERAFQRAHEKFGKINNYTIDKALQTFRNEDFGGLVPKITYTATDHSASWNARIVWIKDNQTYTPLTKFWAPGKGGIPNVVYDVPPDPPPPPSGQ